MDHSGSLPAIRKLCPAADIITSPNGEKGLKKHYGDLTGIKVVNSGDIINTGKRDLQFVFTQMVHWPDSMATYIPQEKLLLPNDAFGQHIATSARFDADVGWDIIKEEAAKYYANIVLPYGNQVLKALEAIAPLDVDMIAPSHGLIWQEHIPGIIEEYGKWAANKTDNEAVIVFDSMWGSTEKIARKIYGVFEKKGIGVSLLNLKATDISDVMTRVLTSEYICVGSPTLNNNLMPTVAAFLTYLKGLAPKNRKALAFGSYGWGGQSVGQAEAMLKDCGFEMLESIKMQYVPDKSELNSAAEKLKGRI
jgi:flavorubredoxin